MGKWQALGLVKAWGKDELVLLYIYRSVAILYVHKTALPKQDGTPLTLEHLLIFFTGTDREPPTGFYPKPTMTFWDEDLATAS